jgi:outer membrane receptor protein involved in Fe transport
MNIPLKAAASAAVRYGLIALIGAGSVSAQTSQATADTKKDDAQKLEKFEVTGSRVKRLDAETPAPVVQITKAEIDQSGFTTLGDFVQSLPFNSGSANSVIQTASFTRGAATVNPRGLGSNRFLVLINGRRAINYALTNSNNQSVFDFNSIPLGAIDSIDYLKDGASAIYGSDAVTGVMDIKLKKNFSGVAADITLGNTLGHDTFTKSGSLIVGAQSSKTSILVVGNYIGTNANFIRDYDRSKTTDYSFLGAKGQNLNSSLNFPANVNLTAAQAAAAGYTSGAGLYVLSGGAPTANPTRSQFTRVAAAPNENRYDFAQTYQLSPPIDYYGIYTNIRHDISDRLYAFGQVLYNQNSTSYSFTPAVIQSTQNTGTGPTGLLNVPPTNPYNPFGVDLTNFLYRTNFGPPRQFDTEGSTASILGGLGGNLTPDWSWEVAAARAQSNVSSVSRNQIRAADLQAALNGTTRQTALNPFGPSDNPDVVNRLFTVSNSAYKARTQALDGNVQGLLPWDLGSGPIGVAVGTEYRRDMIQQDPDTAAYVGTGGGTPYRGDRSVFSAYAEVNIPVLRRLEFQFAGRYEDYNDFGTTTKPKVAAKFKVPETRFVDVLLRASFSQSFKAPDLGRLYTAATTAFSSTVRNDPKRPQDPPTQLRIVTGGNRNLQPEEADTYYGGAVIDVKAVKGLSFAVDYFKFNIDNVISSPSDTTLLAREDQFPGAVVRDSTQGNPGPILFVRRVPFNVAKQWYEGMDFEAKYDLRNTIAGNFRFLVNATRTFSIKSNSGIRDANGNLPADFENVGLYNNPKWNGTASVAWTYKDYGASVFVRHQGKYFNDGYTAAGWGENPVNIANAQVSYAGLFDTKITLGVNNVFDKQPPRNGYETTGFDQNTYGWMSLGRFVFVRLQRSF